MRMSVVTLRRLVSCYDRCEPGLRRQGLRSCHLPLAKPQEHSAMSAPDFTVDVFQNEYLPDGAREVNAIVTVTSAGSAADGMTGPASAAEIIIVDCSPSMEVPGKKLIQAGRATAAAIDIIRDGTAFAVVAGAGRCTRNAAAWRSPMRTRERPPNARCGAAARAPTPRSGYGWDWHGSFSRRARTRYGTRSCSPTARMSANPPRT